MAKKKKAAIKRWCLMRRDGRIVGLASRRRTQERALNWGGATYMWDPDTKIVRIEIRVVPRKGARRA